MRRRVTEPSTSTRREAGALRDEVGTLDGPFRAVRRNSRRNRTQARACRLPSSRDRNPRSDRLPLRRGLGPLAIDGQMVAAKKGTSTFHRTHIGVRELDNFALLRDGSPD
jgi:hypothetical protein